MMLKKRLLTIDNISVAYDSKVVLNDVSLAVDDNDFVGIVGPNGGGKSTLLKAIVGLIPISSGKITFSEELAAGGKIGYLSQINNFDKKFPITVSEVVLSGLLLRSRVWRRFLKSDKIKVETIAEKVGISDIINKPIGELSGGQMQRVFLARAIISEPKLLVLDEPGTYIDAKFEREMMSMLCDLNERMAIILVSHNIDLVKKSAKDIVHIDRSLVSTIHNEQSLEMNVQSNL